MAAEGLIDFDQKLDSGLAPRTVRYIHTTLHKALREALSDGLVPRNVTDAGQASMQGIVTAFLSARPSHPFRGAATKRRERAASSP